jgi:hypothetical protein
VIDDKHYDTAVLRRWWWFLFWPIALLRRWRLWWQRRKNGTWVTVGIMMDAGDPPLVCLESLILDYYDVRGDIKVCVDGRAILEIADRVPVAGSLAAPYRVERGQAITAFGHGSVALSGLVRVPSAAERRERRRAA